MTKRVPRILAALRFAGSITTAIPLEAAYRCRICHLQALDALIPRQLELVSLFSLGIFGRRFLDDARIIEPCSGRG